MTAQLISVVLIALGLALMLTPILPLMIGGMMALARNNELTLRQEARAKEDETRNSETFHWNPAG
jgi:hypothetical protein